MITEHGAVNASTRYRALQYADRLRRRFAAVDVLLPRDDLRRGPGRWGQAAFFARHAVRYATRAFELTRCSREYDAVLIQRGAYPVGPDAVVRWLDDYEGNVVLDLDDAVFLPHPALEAKGRFTRWLYGPQQTRRVLQRADAVVVSTPELAAALPPGAPTPHVVPTVPDPARYVVRRHEDVATLRMAWIGNGGNLGYLDTLRPVLAELSDRGLATLEVVSSSPWRGPATFRRWRLQEEASVFSDYDIQIMPLPDTPYTRAKAGFKLLQAMAAGIPVIASPVGANRSLVSESRAGILAASPAEWREAVERLSEAALRRRLGHQGRTFVERFADLDGAAALLGSLLAAPRRGSA
jgi:hypothetical protein